jgi:hypothetical protein
MLCHHTAHLDVDAYDDGVLARRFAPRVVCQPAKHRIAKVVDFNEFNLMRKK